MFRRALISTDFTDGLYRLGYALPSLVAGGLQDITLFHTVPVQTERSVPRIDEEAVAAARQRLQAMVKDIPPSASVEVVVEGGRPSDAILKQVQQRSADVLFLGMPTRSFLTEKLFGSTTMGLVDRTPVPLMILRPQLVSTYTTEELALRCRRLFHHLLIPYDGTEGSTQFLEQLQQQLRQASPPTDHRYLLLWVIDDTIRRELRGDHPLQEAEEKLHQAGDLLRQLGVTVETLVREGDPLEEILRAAEQYDISAIATSSRGIGGFLSWSVPSLTREILRQSWHPVLYFPKPE